MSGLTKYLSAAAVAVGGLLAAPTAQAQGPRPVPTVSPFRPTVFPPPGHGHGHRHHDHDYAVYYRVGGFVGWRHYATFETRDAAERAERRLEWRGYSARVVRVEDRDRYYIQGR